jgi:hypothetical protein
MAASITGEKIVLNFGWKGPSSWHGGSSHGGLDIKVVDLLFKDAKTKISVHIPDNISPSTIQKIPFTCRKYDAQETHPDSLKVMVEQIHNLTIKAGIFEESSDNKGPLVDSFGRITREKHMLRSDREIKFKIPEELEIGQTYSLVVTSSHDLSLSAQLLKEKRADTVMEEGNKASRDEFQSRMKKMGEALVTEGIQNLDLASSGGIGVFDSSSTTADVFAHGMRGVVRSGQQMHPGIRVPYSKPSESPSDLNKLTANELQSRFEATFKKDKEFESQRIRAALAGNVEEMNRVTEAEHANSQLLINLAEALERKGIKALIPQSESFQSAANQSLETHVNALKKLEDDCTVQ